VGSQPVRITDDATTGPEGPGFSYHRVSWSPEGWLAFAGVTRAADRVQSRIYVVDSPGAQPRVIAENDSHFVIYIYWSPATCRNAQGCHRLAYLIEEEPAIGLRQVMLDDGRAENRRVGLGRPIYFSWSPDGRQLLWHSGGAETEDGAARLATFDVEEHLLRYLPENPGQFLAPAWSPQGTQWLSVSVQDGMNRLQIFEPGQSPTPVATAGGEIAFSWSPDASWIAYAVRERELAPAYGPIHVFAPRTGQSQQLTQDPLDILAFFWSPDGTRLAYLTRLDLPSEVWMQWRVYDLRQQKDRGFAAFRPSPHMNYVIASFGQYAQSHRFWSPNGRYLVYAERDSAGLDRILLVDTQAERGADPLFVDEGTMGFWSFH
jgi:TolB protein